MKCFHPLTAFQLSNGSISFHQSGGVDRFLTLRCGQCIGCRVERSRQWAVRCMHESQMHKDNYFVTLTYDDENLPHDLSLNHVHFQKFMKRVRKKFGPVRFFMCGEYGEENARPHYHACIFGLRLSDLKYWRTSDSGSPCYRSPALEICWRFGSSEVGQVTFESAAYVARYSLKKVTGSGADEHYQSVNVHTGELYQRDPEYARMSLKPGIGFTWFEKYGREVFPRDRVVVNGREVKPPRYYFELLQREDYVESYAVGLQRTESAALADPKEFTRSRMAACETVASARLSTKVRKL